MIVRLNDDTIGKVTDAMIDEYVTVAVQDENGNVVFKSGYVVEIMER